MNHKNGICHICGINKATTKDHIPPSCIFPRSLKSLNIEKITVWACNKCNNEMSKVDETFRDYLSLCIFTHHREEVWEQVKKKLIKSPRLRNEMLSKVRNLYPKNYEISPRLTRRNDTFLGISNGIVGLLFELAT